MLYEILKIGLTVLVIVAVSELTKRHSNFAALVASLPLTSLLAFVWIYLESGSGAKVEELSRQIFWLVLASLPLFLLLPVLLRSGLNFWLALSLSIAATTGLYAAMFPLARFLGTRL